MFEPSDFDIRIIWDAYAIKRFTVKRTWRERLFTAPWRPLQKVRIVEEPAMYFLRNIQTFVAHPALKDAIARGYKLK